MYVCMQEQALPPQNGSNAGSGGVCMCREMKVRRGGEKEREDGKMSGGRRWCAPAAICIPLLGSSQPSLPAA